MSAEDENILSESICHTLRECSHSVRPQDSFLKIAVASLPLPRQSQTQAHIFIKDLLCVDATLCGDELHTVVLN